MICTTGGAAVAVCWLVHGRREWRHHHQREDVNRGRQHFLLSEMVSVVYLFIYFMQGNA